MKSYVKIIKEVILNVFLIYSKGKLLKLLETSIDKSGNNVSYCTSSVTLLGL